MILQPDIIVNNDSVVNRITVLINQIYRLLPIREEGIDWQRPLATIIEEFAGMDRLFYGHHDDIFFPLLCKLEGLNTLTKEEDFYNYRSAIFECLNLAGRLKKICQDQIT